MLVNNIDYLLLLFLYTSHDLFTISLVLKLNFLSFKRDTTYPTTIRKKNIVKSLTEVFTKKKKFNWGMKSYTRKETDIQPKKLFKRRALTSTG